VLHERTRGGASGGAGRRSGEKNLGDKMDEVLMELRGINLRLQQLLDLHPPQE
jgi:hypothetical protein